MNRAISVILVGIAVLLLAGAACSPEPYPTATAYPTATHYPGWGAPTPTPYPIATPYPTATPYPGEATPTAAATPTPRRRPTATPRPTRRPIPTAIPSICRPGMWQWIKWELDPIWSAIPSDSLIYSNPRLSGWNIVVEFFPSHGVYEANAGWYVGEYRTLAAAQCAAAQAALRRSR